eukprot:4755179-Pyramimonas_sp.AAC.2
MRFYSGCGSTQDAGLLRIWFFSGCGSTQDLVLLRIWFFSGCGPTQDPGLLRIWFFSGCDSTQDPGLLRIWFFSGCGSTQDPGLLRIWFFSGSGSTQDLVLLRIRSYSGSGTTQDPLLRVSYEGPTQDGVHCKEPPSRQISVHLVKLTASRGAGSPVRRHVAGGGQSRTIDEAACQWLRLVGEGRWIGWTKNDAFSQSGPGWLQSITEIQLAFLALGVLLIGALILVSACSFTFGYKIKWTHLAFANPPVILHRSPGGKVIIKAEFQGQPVSVK